MKLLLHNDPSHYTFSQDENTISFYVGFLVPLILKDFVNVLVMCVKVIFFLVIIQLISSNDAKQSLSHLGAHLSINKRILGPVIVPLP